MVESLLSAGYACCTDDPESSDHQVLWVAEVTRPWVEWFVFIDTSAFKWANRAHDPEECCAMLGVPCMSFNDWSLPLAVASGTEDVPSQGSCFIH